MRKTPTQRMLERSTGRDTGELLRELYVEKRHSQVEIGEALGISRGAVQQWLDQFGISRDERAPVTLDPVA
jgi:DNA-binding MarR family transcriptional regulator